MADGRIVLLSAPLGDPANASSRFRSALAEADLVAAEDTGQVARLARDLGVQLTGRVVDSFDSSESFESSEGDQDRRTPSLLAAARDGACVALLTGGGMPSVSDPGLRLVAAAHEAGVPVTVVPGPSAVTAALVVSGLPCDRFCCEGFPPRHPAARRARLAALAAEQRTLVFSEAPHRLGETLADLAEAFGADRPAALCQDPTQPSQQVRRDTLGGLTEWAAAHPPRGEITLVVSGAPAAAPALDEAALRAAVAAHQAAGASHRDAVTAVAREYGVRRRDVYELTAGHGGPAPGPGGAP